ncbi:MAG: hypothetical protein GDA39_04760 [Hyphomonadaceae bacterium]|nr:hypothetical protein [Hyphomonadaceae bacterium]MBC6412232.1 hypothetical protein [Hyphomonadaceae bacterium]
MSAKGTTHHKIHGLTGWGLIIGLPFAIFGALKAIGGGSQGFVDWLSSPTGAVGFLAFATAAIWYCKLEFDEVVMDYTDGGLRSLGLNLNRLVALAIWAVSAFAVLKLWLGA